MKNYLKPMEPLPELKDFAHRIELPKSRLSIFTYDCEPSNSKAVMLIHGLGDEADTWRHLIPPLRRYYRVIAPDLPGFGRSDKPETKYTIPFLSQVLFELQDVLEVRQSVLIGHSLGAIISQTIALEQPERVNGLVLVGGTLLSRAQNFSLKNILFLTPGVGEWLYNRLRKDPQAAYDTLYPFYFDMDGLPEVDRDFLFQRVNQRVWDDDQRGAYFSSLRNVVPYVMKQQRGLAERLARMDIPTHVIWGANDQVVPVENGQALVKAQPSARLTILPETGHNAQQENPQELIQAILADERLGI